MTKKNKQQKMKPLSDKRKVKLARKLGEVRMNNFSTGYAAPSNAFANGDGKEFFRPDFYARLQAEAARNIGPEIDYLKALVSPESCAGARYPGDNTNQTATYQQIFTYETTGADDNSVLANQGRFCFIIKPILTTTNAIGTSNQTNTVVVSNDGVAWTGQLSSSTFVPLQDVNSVVIIPNGSTDGFATRVRTVSASAWVAYTGSTLNNAGDIAAALLPSGAYNQRFSATSTSLSSGNGTWWENLSAFRNATSNPIKYGSYVWWKPACADDTNMYSAEPTASNTTRTWNPDMMVISGRIPPSSMAGQPSTVRLRVVINYEYETYSTVIPTQPSPYCPGALELAAQVLAYCPNAMANDDHGKWIKALLKGVVSGASGFLLGGPPGAAAALLGAAGVAAVKAVA